MAPTLINPAVRVVVVGSNPLLSAGLVALLGGSEGMEVVAVGGTADQRRDVEADVAVVSLVGLGVDAANRTVRDVRAGSETKVVAVVDGAKEALDWVGAARVDACLNFGTVDSHALVDAVRAVMGGQAILSTELLSELRSRERAMAPEQTLTPRERDVLALLAEGQTNKSIACHLGLQARTVSVYVSMILAKLGVANRTEAAVATLQHGLLTVGTHPAGANNEIATARRRKVEETAG